MTNPEMERRGHTDPLGITAENLAEEREIPRVRQDRFALHSHEKAVAAIDAGRFDDETVAVTVNGRKGDTVVETDEGPRRDCSLEALAKLKPVFKEDGTVTAGNSSPLNDGAAAVMVTSADYAKAHGLDAARQGALGGRGRRAAADHGHRPGAGHRRRRWSGPGWASTTST